MAASDLPPFFARAYGAVAAAAAGQGLEVAGEPFAFCPNTPTEVVEVAARFPVSGAVQPAGDVVPMELPGGAGSHDGPRRTVRHLHETSAQMREWMAAQGLTPADHMWEVCLTDPSTEPDPASWRTRIFQPVKD